MQPTEINENHQESAKNTGQWLSVEQIRKQQRMRREKVIAAVKRRLSMSLSDNYFSLSSSPLDNTVVVVNFFLFGSFSFFVKSCEFL